MEPGLSIDVRTRWRSRVSRLIFPISASMSFSTSRLKEKNLTRADIYVTQTFHLITKKRSKPLIEFGQANHWIKCPRHEFTRRLLLLFYSVT